MKKNGALFDVFVVSGFITGFFYGFLNPVYVSMVLARLDSRIVAAGCFMSSAFPVLIGAMLGNRKVFRRLFSILPAVMLAELAAALAAVIVAAFDLVAYYLVSMLIFGAFSSCVVYLLQKIKETRYRRSRAAFDRRCAMADGIGLLAGSVLSIIGVSLLRDTLAVAILGFLQTAVVYGCFLLLYRKAPERRGRRAAEEPHPCAPIMIPDALPCAA